MRGIAFTNSKNQSLDRYQKSLALLVFNNIFAVICSQPRDKQNCAHDFFLFKYFLNNMHLTVFVQNTLSKLVKL